VCNGKEEQINLGPSSLERIDEKTWKIYVPDVNGVSAGLYEIMNITFQTDGNLGPFTVKIVDGNGVVVFEVCPESHIYLM
jgi:hypothetical protein